MSIVKQVGSSGQITLGKKYAGQIVQVIEEEEKGIITLLMGEFVPKSEQWLHKEPMQSRLDQAIRYAESHPPKKSNLEKL